MKSFFTLSRRGAEGPGRNNISSVHPGHYHNGEFRASQVLRRRGGKVALKIDRQTDRETALFFFLFGVGDGKDGEK